MRRIALLVLAAVCLRAGAADAQQVYSGVLLEYLTGDSDAAVQKVRSVDQSEVLGGLDAFNRTRATLVLPGAAALHTEAALRSRLQGGINAFHLEIATAIVEFGEQAGRLKPNTPYSIAPQHARPVSDDFRAVWYCAVIGVLEDAGRLALARTYLDHALALFPQNGEIQLLAGIAEEMRGSPRVAGLNAGDRRDAMKAAEKHYRAAVAAEPDRLEARLRLARVLQQDKDLNSARALLTPLLSSADVRLAYLSALFLGGIEDASRHPDAALALYDQAAARLPTAQTARLAASELRHRKGDRRAAADAVPAAAGDGNAFDPWWTYIFGEYWRGDLLLDALRRLRRA